MTATIGRVKPPRCRDCDALIEWAVNEKNGRRVPLDPGEDPDGTVVRVGQAWDGAIIVTVHPTPQVALSVHGLDARLHRLHRYSCPVRGAHPPRTVGG